MTRIDFYLLKENFSAAQLNFACKIIEKAYAQAQTVFVQTASSEQAQQLDDLLWTFKEDSFIPHSLYDATAEIIPPIVIGVEQLAVNPSDILLNLTTQLPSALERYKRIIEIIPHTDELRLHARNLYRQYRDAGCDMNSHDLGKN